MGKNVVGIDIPVWRPRLTMTLTERRGISDLLWQVHQRWMFPHTT